MSFADMQVEAPDARRPRATHPKGFEPGVKFSVDSGLPESAVISSTVDLDATYHRAKIIEQTGLRVPDSRDVRLERLTLPSIGVGIAERWWYKDVSVHRATGTRADDYDHIAALKAFRRNRDHIQPKYVGPSTFCLSWNDWQVGKAE